MVCRYKRIRVVAATPALLDTGGTALQKWVTQLPETKSVVFESLGGEPWLKLELDPAAATDCPRRQ